MTTANGWGNDNNNTNGADSVVLIIAGRPDKVTTWSQYYQMDSRFRVATFATSVDDLQSKLAYNPEAILLDGQVFHGPQQMVEFLTSVQAAVYLVLPEGIPQNVLDALSEIKAVKGKYLGDVDLRELAGRMFETARTLRSQAPSMEQAWGGTRSSSGIGGGVRAITVWNRVGGAGKTTVAAALGIAAAQRGLKTMLVGLGTPDPLPAILKLSPHKNISGWVSRSSMEEGVLPNLQQVGGMDVLCGMQDVARERALAIPSEEPASLNKLAMAASFAGYGVIIFDAPVSTPALLAISASNTMVMVARPMVADAVASAEAYRIVTQKLSGQHSIGLGNIYVTLNQSRSGLLAHREFQETAIAITRQQKIRDFPPITVVIPDAPEVQYAANEGRTPMDASDAFAREIHKLADIMFGTGAKVAVMPSKNGKGERSLLGGLVKIKK